MLNHALTKSLLFFGAGNILRKYHSKNIADVKGMATLMPVTAALFVAGALAITGSPPFGIFISEIMILKAGLDAGNYIVSVAYLALLAVIFAGFIYHVGRMAYGEPAPGRAKGESGWPGLAVMATLLLLTLVLGLYIPAGLSDILNQIAAVFGGTA
jgi:hydrogenase-4 component F